MSIKTSVTIEDDGLFVFNGPDSKMNDIAMQVFEHKLDQAFLRGRRSVVDSIISSVELIASGAKIVHMK